MPGIHGLEAQALLGAAGPEVVFVTAHAQHAATAFERGVTDYVLKPVDGARLRLALDRVRARRARFAATRPRFAVPVRGGLALVEPDEVCAAVLEGTLVRLLLPDRELWSDASLQTIAERVGPEIERVHRRALLRLSVVERLETLGTGGFMARTRHGHAVEVSRQAARALRRRLT
jgi:DNA-binding LytR/AlgR family response regulator